MNKITDSYEAIMKNLTSSFSYCPFSFFHAGEDKGKITIILSYKRCHIVIHHNI